MDFWTTPGAIEEVAGKHRLSEQVVARLTNPTISMCGGGAHAAMSLAQHPRPFDFVLQEAPDLPLDANAELLPYEAVRRVLEADVKQFLDLSEEVQRRSPGPVWHVDAPPPVGDAEFMRPHIPWPLFPGRDHEVAFKWHRYRMWRLNSEISRDWCRSHGVGFIGHAEAGTDAEGFLRPDCCIDGVHGNDRYGQYLGAKIAAILNGARLGPNEFAPATASMGSAR